MISSDSKQALFCNGLKEVGGDPELISGIEELLIDIPFRLLCYALSGVPHVDPSSLRVSLDGVDNVVNKLLTRLLRPDVPADYGVEVDL